MPRKTVKTKKQTTARNATTAPVKNQKQTGMVSFGRAIANFFNKYFQFNGTATRAEYWWVVLFVAVITVVVMWTAPMLQHFNPVVSGLVAILWALFLLVCFVPWWTLQARRLHDAGFSAKLLLISLVFFAYAMLVPEVVNRLKVVEWLNVVWSVLMLILFVLPSKKQDNPYRD